MRRNYLMALIAAFTLAACGGDGDGGTGPGNGGTPAFTATVTGDVETTVKGDAMFGEVSDPQAGQIFAVEMSEDDPTGGALIQIIRMGSGIPGTGTYPLLDGINGTPAEGDWVAAAYDSENGQLVGLFVATSGSVKVTSASSSSFEGTFDFIAVGGLIADPTQEMTIAVNGKFKAKSAPGGAMLRAPISRMHR